MVVALTNSIRQILGRLTNYLKTPDESALPRLVSKKRVLRKMLDLLEKKINLVDYMTEIISWRTRHTLSLRECEDQYTG